MTKGVGGKSVITGVKLGQGKVGGGALAPSASKAFYPGGKATNPKVGSVGAIPAAKPKAGTRPNVHPVQRP
jgi:hypothetical protein